MRKQYHFYIEDSTTLIWDVHRLVELSSNFEVIKIALANIKELNQPYWFEKNGNTPTCKAIANHAKLINETDLKYPIILSQKGRVMDGMHRVSKAYMLGLKFIKAVQFENDPLPDYKNLSADELSYE